MEIRILSSKRPVRFAAMQLEYYLKRMLPDAAETGSSPDQLLPPYIELDVRDMNNSLSSQGSALMRSVEDPELDDAFMYSFSDKKSFIYASNPRAVLLGVYHYLHEIGCRFLQPGASYEVIPTLKRARDFYAQNLVRASMRHRGACIEGAESVENVLDFIDFLPKLGYNSFFLQFRYPHTFLERWYDHVRNPRLAAANWQLSQSVGADQIFQQALEERGLMVHRVGHGWTGEAIGYTATGWEQDQTILSPQKIELLAKVKGVRGLFGGVPTNTNLCYSNPKAIQLFTSAVTDYAKEHPSVDYLHVWLADLPNNVCECENCRKKSLTDHYIHLLNVIDEKLTKEKLATRIVFLLYQELMWAPETESLNNPERFVLMFAPISRTFLKSYRDSDLLPPIPPYRLNQIVQPRTMEENLAYLKGWQEKVSCDSFVYDYHLGKAHYGDPGYLKLSQVIADDLKTNRMLGLNGFNSCQELRAFFPNALPNYTMGRIGLEAELVFREVADEFFEAAYGPDHTRVFSYLRRLSDLFDMDYVMGYKEPLSRPMQSRLTSAIEHCQGFEDSIAEGRGKARNKVQAGFWDRLEAHRKYTILLCEALIARAKGEDSTLPYRAFCDYVRKLEEDYDLQRALDGYRVLEVTNVYTRMSEGVR